MRTCAPAAPALRQVSGLPAVVIQTGNSFWIGRGNHQTFNSRMNQGTGAHRTGFQRNVQRGAGKAVILLCLTSGSHGHDFRVRSRIVCAHRLVISFGKQPAFENHHGADRDLPCLLCLAGILQCTPHPFLIRCREHQTATLTLDEP